MASRGLAVPIPVLNLDIGLLVYVDCSVGSTRSAL